MKKEVLSAIAISLLLMGLYVAYVAGKKRGHENYVLVPASESMPIASSQPTPPQEPKWAADLRAKAASMGLQWQVFCTTTSFDEPDLAYLAYAKQPNDTLNYIEDGGLPSWSGQGKTMKAAGLSLLRALDHPPNRLPEHAPKRRAGKQCKGNISGGPGLNQKLATADNCPDCEVGQKPN